MTDEQYVWLAEAYNRRGERTAQIIHEQDHFYYTSSGAKTHLFENCVYATDVRKVESEALPESHIDLCSRCVESYQNWFNGISEAFAPEADASLTEDGTVPESRTTRLDGDIWRYACPDCGTQVRKQSETTAFCSRCHETLEITELMDLKQQ